MSLPPPPPPPPPGGPPVYPGAAPQPFGAFPPAPQFAPLAGFGARLGGYLLDSILYGLLVALFAIPGSLTIAAAFDGCQFIDYADGTSEILCDDGTIEGGLIAGGVAIILVGVILVAVLYIRALGRTGQTWGRKIVGVKVIRQDNGAPIGVGKAIGRLLFAGLVSAQVVYLGYLWMLWDDRKQTWHDKIVGSIVIRT